MFNTIWGKQGKECVGWLHSLQEQDEQKRGLVRSCHRGSVSCYLSQPKRFFTDIANTCRNAVFPDLFTHHLGQCQVYVLTTGAQDPEGSWKGGCSIKGQWSVLRTQTVTTGDTRSQSQRSHFWVPALVSLKSILEFGKMTETVPPFRLENCFLSPTGLMCYSREFSEKVGWPL